ncbi:MAG: ABC transporter permease [Chitinophagaceae bacterium]
MFKNYFIIASRNFWRNKTFSLINVLGLSVGICSALVIFLIVYYEFSYDKCQPGRDRIYRVVLDAKFNGVEGHSTGVPAPLGAAIQNETTGVEQTVPVFQFQGDATAKVTIAKEGSDKGIIFKKQADIVFTNDQYFYLLPFKWVAGSPAASLRDPFSVVLTESRAKQYFPSIPAGDIIGKQIAYNDELRATVSGIVKDLNRNTSFSAVEFISLSTIAKTNLQDRFMMTVWNDWMAYSQLYVKLSENISTEQTEAQLKTILSKYNKDANKDANNGMAFHLQPLKDIHFNSSYPGIGQRLAHKPTLYGLLAIAGFLLLLGCINFINLTTANAAHRSKEIGIRKTMGSSRKQLVFQFLGETFFITLIATIISVAFAPLLLNVFKDFIPRGVSFDWVNQPFIFLFLFILVVLVSFLSGLYPALVLSGYKTIAVLKTQSSVQPGETRHAWVRKSLTVSQFVIAQFFIIATVMVARQINYSLKADLGFKKEAIITFNAPWDTVATHGKQLLNDINAIPEVQLASTGFLSPADKGVAFTNVSYPEKKDLNANIQIRWGDTNYLHIYQIRLLAGRNILPSDSMKEFIINNTYAKMLDFQKPEDAIGKLLSFNGKNMPIVGVMKDFHDQSMRGNISPLVFAGSNGSTFHIRLKPNVSGAVWRNGISKIQKVYKQIYPEEDFEYKFFDETIASFYESELHTASLLKWATGLAILISCLGLSGLVMYTINTRTKEIGVRKILGASVSNIISVLSTDFIRLVFIAFLIAAPLAWWVIYKWLEEYAYRTSLSWWVFAISGFSLLFIALITLSIQTIKAATANPVKSLRTE